ncbi:hypothetical protein [Streptomyces erythrochromogenes]|uniref:hypothetical protein n=1 Tax=Streptomyces erythrochromogenes TaxID=285574 RepID=UPI00343FE8B1
MTRPTAAAVAQRRARVAELTRDNSRTIRDIAAELGVHKDVVYRDRLVNAATAAATATTPDRDTPASTATRRALYRDKAGQAADAMAALRAAVTATAAARPAYQILVDDETAAHWIAQLREDVATLAAVADSFRDYYPYLTDPTATPPSSQTTG